MGFWIINIIENKVGQDGTNVLAPRNKCLFMGEADGPIFLIFPFVTFVL